jgi:peptidoglycan hydrolase-like protein with peptidoglycan-binding domain
VRRLLVALAGAGLLFGGLVVAALVAWPQVGFAGSRDGLVRVVLPGYAGTVTAVEASSGGVPVAVRLSAGTISPRRLVPAGARLSIAVTVRRPGWIGWLVGRREVRSIAVTAPRARLVERSLAPTQGAPISVRFDMPVSVVAVGGGAPRHLARPRKVVPLGIAARGSDRAGAVTVAAAARPWERLSAPVRVAWFVPAPRAQLLAEPKPGTTIAPERKLMLTFSLPVAKVLGTRRPRLVPAMPGRWRQPDAYTLVFQPRGLGFGLGATVEVRLPRPALLAGAAESTPRRTLRYRVVAGSTLRLQQLLAEQGYLPLDWQPAADPADSPRAELAAAVSPPPGRFTWRYPHTPPVLRRLWRSGRPNEIVQGAIMAFENAHDLPVDGLPGPKLWRTLLTDALAGRRHKGGYSYVFVHRSIPQSLNLWHDGRVVVRSPGNTGVPAAPTELGTWPVFEHIRVGTMSGTNPDGSHYDDPGVQYISYFHGGDAIHAFNRASYGTPQSLGCVELPLAAAALVWPYTPIGTLVTIEN